MKPFFGKTKPSEFLQAMLDGLNNLYPNQRVRMSTYGTVEGETCYGCAATYALQNLVGRPLSPYEISEVAAHKFHTEYASSVRVLQFEVAINMARLGRFKSLLEFCELPHASATAQRWNDRWQLAVAPSVEQQECIEAVIREMQEIEL